MTEATTIELGDTYMTQDGPIEIVTTAYDGFRVTDPTESHPQSSRADTWDLDGDLLRKSIERREILPCRVGATPLCPGCDHPIGDGDTVCRFCDTDLVPPEATP